MRTSDFLSTLSVWALPLFLSAAQPDRAAAGQARIYWLDLKGSGSVHSSKPDGSDAKTLVTGNGVSGPDGVAVDAATGTIYWTNMSVGGKGSVQKANLDGSKVEYVIAPGGTFFPKQIQIDKAHGRLYWCDRDGFKIQRSNLDGSQPEILISGLQNPVGMALDTAGGYFYFSDKNAQTLQRAPMAMPPAGRTAANRKDIETLISGLQRPIDLALDLAKRQIYWTDRDEGTVHRAGMEIPAGRTAATRNDIETLVKGLSTPIGMALDLPGGKLYFTEAGNGAVSRANLDGTGKEILEPGGGGSSLTGMCFAVLQDTAPTSLRAKPGAVRANGMSSGGYVDALGLPLAAEDKSDAALSASSAHRIGFPAAAGR